MSHEPENHVRRLEQVLSIALIGGTVDSDPDPLSEWSKGYDYGWADACETVLELARKGVLTVQVQE